MVVTTVATATVDMEEVALVAEAGAEEGSEEVEVVVEVSEEVDGNVCFTFAKAFWSGNTRGSCIIVPGL